MEKEKKKGKGIKIIVIVVILICIAIVVFFISSKLTNNSQEVISGEINNTYTEENEEKTNNIDTQEENEVSTISDEQLEKFVEQKFRKTGYIGQIDKFEKYDEDGKGRYIYVIYYGDNFNIYLIDTTEFLDDPDMEGYGGGRYFPEAVRDLAQELREKNDWGKDKKSTSSRTYLSDTALKALAFKKWLEEDSYINLQYNNNSCVYTGEISKNSDGSVSVYLVLYRKDIYDLCIQYNQPLSGSLGSATVRLTKKEATK